ncbi:hypothetical protein SLH32_35780 (plasmid) [Streptomyces sp. KHY 26]
MYATEPGQRRVAVAPCHVTEDLVVGPVPLDDQEDVLDRRRVARLHRDRHGRRVAGAPGDRGAVPAVLGEDLPLRAATTATALDVWGQLEMRRPLAVDAAAEKVTVMAPAAQPPAPASAFNVDSPATG